MKDQSEQINKALLAHGAWKHRLNTAVTTGKSEFTVAQVETDDRCDFGQWFYGLPADLRATQCANKVRELHAQFHREAARVLGLALRGDKEHALKALGPGEKYSTVSGQLTLNLQKWERELAGH